MIFALPVFVNTINDTITGMIGGSMWAVAFIIMGFFLIGFMMAGIDFRYALLFTAPLILVFARYGWFPGAWISTAIWIIVVLVFVIIMYLLLRG